ncbi:hypothetical protein AVEN_199186-1 [Araneus ventricosus]|uniref:EGF-like domain-containing protein n=1 Tax=Araneus ventricosus TaxID=182803 RepID=A0A4Y2MDD9_ARAVE|nr:hypothetical protein AVEN_199186-1 [Araneus ventricosus]
MRKFSSDYVNEKIPECDCGPQGRCSFEEGLKKCTCENGFDVKDGICIECDCGPNGMCNFENDLKMCNCEPIFLVKDGKCTECDCGPKGKCSFENGLKNAFAKKDL